MLSHNTHESILRVRLLQLLGRLAGLQNCRSLTEAAAPFSTLCCVGHTPHLCKCGHLIRRVEWTQWPQGQYAVYCSAGLVFLWPVSRSLPSVL